MYKNCYYIQLDSRGEKLLRMGEFLGSGHNGIVYLLPNKRIVKIFKEQEVCEKEYDILKRASKCKHFPKTYEHGTHYIVRDYVGGIRLDKYLKKKGINKQISVNIVNLIREFRDIGFNKLDIRCKDLFVAEDFTLTVIDPKNNYSKNVSYPRHLMKGLNNLGVLEEFLEGVKAVDTEIYEFWSLKIHQYLDKGIK